MKTRTTTELNADFDSTLASCSSKILNDSDELVSRHIFEEFDVGATSFLHPSSLQRLLEAGYVDNEIKELCATLRAEALSAIQNHRSVAAVRTEPSWRGVIELSDRIK